VGTVWEPCDEAVLAIEARIRLLDSRPYSAQSDAVRCEASLTVLSLALPAPSRVTDFSVSAAPTLEGSQAPVCWTGTVHTVFLSERSYFQRNCGSDQTEIPATGFSNHLGGSM